MTSLGSPGVWGRSETCCPLSPNLHGIECDGHFPAESGTLGEPDEASPEGMLNCSTHLEGWVERSDAVGEVSLSLTFLTSLTLFWTRVWKQWKRNLEGEFSSHWNFPETQKLLVRLGRCTHHSNSLLHALSVPLCLLAEHKEERVPTITGIQRESWRRRRCANAQVG